MIHVAETELFDDTAIPPSGEKVPDESPPKTPNVGPDPTAGSPHANDAMAGVAPPDVTHVDSLSDMPREVGSSAIQFFTREVIAYMVCWPLEIIIATFSR